MMLSFGSSAVTFLLHIFSSHHSDSSFPGFHPSKEPDSRTWEAFKIFLAKLNLSSCSWMFPVVFLCIYIHLVWTLYQLYACLLRSVLDLSPCYKEVFIFIKEMILPSSSLVVFCGFLGLLLLLSSPVNSLTLKSVDLAHFEILPLFCFFSAKFWPL